MFFIFVYLTIMIHISIIIGIIYLNLKIMSKKLIIFVFSFIISFVFWNVTYWTYIRDLLPWEQLTSSHLNQLTALSIDNTSKVSSLISAWYLSAPWWYNAWVSNFSSWDLNITTLNKLVWQVNINRFAWTKIKAYVPWHLFLESSIPSASWSTLLTADYINSLKNQLIANEWIITKYYNMPKEESQTISFKVWHFLFFYSDMIGYHIDNVINPINTNENPTWGGGQYGMGQNRTMVNSSISSINIMWNEIWQISQNWDWQYVISFKNKPNIDRIEMLWETFYLWTPNSEYSDIFWHIYIFGNKWTTIINKIWQNVEVKFIKKL